MQKVTTTASFVEYEALGDSVATMLRRGDLEAALEADSAAQLWLELEQEGDEEARILTIDLESDELGEILRRSSGDEVALAFDGEALTSLFDEPEVEAHGLRGALAIAVTTAAIVAPAGLAAVPQTVGAATTAQRAQAATTAQISSAAAKAQAVNPATKAQVSKSLVVKASGLKLLRSGTVR